MIFVAHRAEGVSHIGGAGTVGGCLLYSSDVEFLSGA